MVHVVLLSLCLWRLDGVFAGTDAVKSVSVMEGDSVSLNSDLTEMMDDDVILWRFGDENTLIAEINVMADSMTVYDDDPDGRFRDRLKLDHQTGSLIITHTTTEHAGVYKLQMSSVIKSFSLTVYARLPVPVISSNSTHCSSSSSSSSSSSHQNCTLLCSVLNVEYQDKNTYSCVLNNPISNQTTHLDINTLCHTCAVPPVSVSLIVLISAGSLMIVFTVVVIFCICRKCRTDRNGKC
ncbi:SLAM family member 9-like [Rhinichthys klamathensis goyatoka]|uniref:SLAM family member 9-like n=1 Tax=Rhinichthys klamathensis goyatoka TaxID=3034132 RepID=UPI0024B5C632|nr:SLAM family member 9-like [Rhinichthys klamathensis goyatoka]